MNLPLTARETPWPDRLGEGTDDFPNDDYWRGMGRILLAGYLMAAALDGAGLDTVLAWIAAPDDRRPI
ncbi:hypothetical protein ABTX82_35100 [Streptomyces lavendulae]|uniref:hypothetical protein n=1 Tax=Streptomyces lavendulae TaxID=1914 RepID=UPI0033176487